MKRHAASVADLFAHLTPEARARLAAAQQDPRAARFGLMDLSGLAGGGR